MAETRKPLAGKCVVVTRAAEQSGELVKALEEHGAEVLLLPMVRFAPPRDWTAADAQLLRANDFDAVLFLSANAVRYVFERCGELGVRLERPRIGAVGPATAHALEERGVAVAYVAREHTGESLAREMKDSLAGREVLLPRSDRGNGAVMRALGEIGARVTEIVAYRTAIAEAASPEALERVRRGDVDAVIFASPSAVQNFSAVLGAGELARIAPRIVLAAIGPATAQALREAGLPVAIEAAESSAAGLAGAVVGHFAGREETVRHRQ